MWLVLSVCAACFAFLLSDVSASAGDYSVTYAIDANGKNNAGKIENCEYTRVCEIEPTGWGLHISLGFIYPDHQWVELHVHGPAGCCYSADADRDINLEIKPGLLRVPLYQGRPRRGNEFVRNKRFGVLYLEFSSLR